MSNGANGFNDGAVRYQEAGSASPPRHTAVVNVIHFPCAFALLHVIMSSVEKKSCRHISALVLMTWNAHFLQCAALLILLALIFKVSAWLPHWSAAQPNTLLCLFNNRAQPSVNGYRMAALTKHDSDRRADLTDISLGCSNSPLTNPCPLKLPSCHSQL